MADLFYRGALPLPLQPEQVNADWLQRALRQKAPAATVSLAEVVDVILGTSTKIRVRVQGNDGNGQPLPETLIVKGGFESHSPSMAEMYANEARFYADIQPYVPMVSPLCYFAGSDPDSHQSIVI